jgi:peptide subunit release factor 1 (eRF1)
MATTITRGRLRRLAELRPETGRVLSVFLDLDPSEFATPPARATQINSMMIEAERLIEEQKDQLTHDEHMALREDATRIRQELDPDGLGAGGTRGIAVFACGPAGLFEIVRLPDPVESRVVLGESPFIEPLAMSGETERWCVALVNSRDGRIFIGDEGGLEEVDRVYDEPAFDSNTGNGGWAERRMQNTVARERKEHLEHVAEHLFQTLRHTPYDRLIVGAPEQFASDLEGLLHPYVSERLAGRITVDVENVNAEGVLEAATPVFEEVRRTHEREVLERLRAGLGREGGRAAAGVQDVRAALEQARVEVLLLEPRSPFESEIEKAIEQAAEVLVLRHHPDLGPLGGIAAVLRF